MKNSERDFDRDLSTPSSGSGCGPGWDALLQMLRDMRDGSDDGDDAIYVALVPNQANSAYLGCGGGGPYAAALSGLGTTFAQEVGHALGRMHAPSGGAVNTDPTYPDYLGSPDGGIGEFGFNTSTSDVHDPATTYDFMGGDRPRWVSPYTFINLKEAMVEQFRAINISLVAAPLPHETLHLRFRIHRGGQVELRPSFHLRTTRRLDRRRMSGVACELLDEAGNVLAFHRCHVLSLDQDPDGPFVDYSESMPWLDGATSIRFIARHQILHTHNIESGPPVLDANRSELSYGREPIELAWNAHRHDEQETTSGLTYMLRHSVDNGKTWRVVAAGLTKPSYTLNPRDLRGGENCCLQISASSGIRTTSIQGHSFTAPQSPRKAYILSPDQESTFRSGSPVLLRGGAVCADFGLAEMGDTVWTSSRDGRLGRGFQLVTQ
ncbi:hypothetical protein [Arthrobacter sp. ISL-5]|uniref:hypothetical protein n=1 Tax=Arthrobacter sp. ISL-5 TaxID=2819111 RepID=UPI001BE4E979|nr:hypothetical protein [Arthrobacter sp. ISL-5]MBT2555991.1 hypothetical protein [Arthrobacter sp. ISL-5]